jgi:hypothetical protein
MCVYPRPIEVVISYGLGVKHFYLGRGSTRMHADFSVFIFENPRPIEVVISCGLGLNPFYLGRGLTRMHTDKAKRISVNQHASTSN